MVTIGDRWDAIIDLIRQNSHLLGVRESNVIAAAFDDRPLTAPPFIAVAMVPGDFLYSIDSRPLIEGGTVEIFCAVGAEYKSSKDRMLAAIRMARTLFDLCIDHGFVARSPQQPIVLDTATATLTAVNIQFFTQCEIR